MYVSENGDGPELVLLQELVLDFEAWPHLFGCKAFRRSLENEGLGLTWTPKVCRIIAFKRLRAIILSTFGDLGRV